MAAYSGAAAIVWGQRRGERETGDGRGQFYLGFRPQLATFVDPTSAPLRARCEVSTHRTSAFDCFARIYRC